MKRMIITGVLALAVGLTALMAQPKRQDRRKKWTR